MTKASVSRIARKRTPHLEQDNRMVHKLVKKTAMEMAGAFYEWQAVRKMYGDNFYANYPSVDSFMQRDWPNFVLVAKQAMTEQLTDPNVPEREKMEIYDALLNDSSLPYSQQEVQITNFRH